MSIKVLNAVSRKQFKTGYEKAVIGTLARYASDDGGRAFPSVETIAAEIQFSTRQVQRALRGMVARGILSIVAGGKGGRHRTTEYRINLAAVEALPETKKGDHQSPLNGQKGDYQSQKGDHQSPDTLLNVKKDKRDHSHNLPTLPAHSAPNGAGAIAPSEVNAEIWKIGLDLLKTNGRADAPARTMIGQWCKRAETQEQKTQLAEAIRRAAQIGTGDPVAYVNAAMARIAPQEPDPSTLNANDWRLRAKVACERQEWPKAWGPRPGLPGCLLPSEFISPDLLNAVARAA